MERVRWRHLVMQKEGMRSREEYVCICMKERGSGEVKWRREVEYSWVEEWEFGMQMGMRVGLCLSWVWGSIMVGFR